VNRRDFITLLAGADVFESFQHSRAAVFLSASFMLRSVAGCAESMASLQLIELR
jgi:hypothetical protein